MKRIKDLRTRGIGTHGIQQESSVEDAVREFLVKDVSALVVYDGEKLVGIFTRNDLVRCCGDHPDGIRALKVGDYMKTDVFTTTVDANLDDVMEIIRSRLLCPVFIYLVPKEGRIVERADLFELAVLHLEAIEDGSDPPLRFQIEDRRDVFTVHDVLLDLDALDDREQPL